MCMQVLMCVCVSMNLSLYEKLLVATMDTLTQVDFDIYRGCQLSEC